MFPWMNPWFGLFKYPLSGDVEQDFLNQSRFFSPEINIKGNPRIESEVISEVASYGKQLGKISEAVLEIADGKPGKAVDELKEQMASIETIKEKHKLHLENDTREMLDKLKKEDPKALKKVLSDYR